MRAGLSAPPVFNYLGLIKLAKAILRESMGSSGAVESNPNQRLWIVDHRVRIGDNPMKADIFLHIFFPVFVS